MKIRIRFGKYGHLRFVGHLDVMRFFQKAMKRGGVDIAYSQGFSPHQIMSFAQPLGLGMSSDAEYMDVELNSAASGKEVMDKLNAVSVPELPVLSCRKLPDNAKAGMAIIEAARYRIGFKEGCPFALDQAWERFVAGEEILIDREGKKARKERQAGKEPEKERFDIRPYLYESKVENGELELMIAAGSAVNIRPEQVVEALFCAEGQELSRFALRLHRMELYTKDEERGFISLGDMGEEF